MSKPLYRARTAAYSQVKTMAGILRYAGCAGVLVGLPLLIAGTGGCSGAAQVRAVFMALDGAGDRPRNTFYPDTTQIYCDVSYSGADADSTVVAEFIQTTGEKTLFDGSDTRVPVANEWAAIETAGPVGGITLLNFSMQPPVPVDGGDPLPYPVGDWQCIVSVNGVQAGQADFKIVYPDPDCPPSGVASDKSSCIAYKTGAQCPSASNFNNATACNCSPTASGRTWSCTQ